LASRCARLGSNTIGTGDRGLGTGTTQSLPDPSLSLGDQPPNPNPQSLIPSPQSPVPSPYLVLAIAALLYLTPLLLDAPLTDPDEGRHAIISQEMIERGDFVVPRLFGSPFLDKPILFFWAQAASLRLFGMTTAAARLPGMLFALLGIITTGWLARVLANEAGPAGLRIGSVAGGCYATMMLPFLLAQAPVHDMALVPFTNLALGFLWRAGRSGAFRDSLLAGVALGLATLTKGLEGIAIVGIGYTAYLLATRTLTRRLVALGILVVVVAVLVALPWYVAMNARAPGYLGYYFLNRHVLGFVTESQRHGGQAWWYYIPLLVAGGLPWIVYVRRSALSDASGKLLWIWLAASLVLLSLSNSKAVTYILPVMPAIAILASRSQKLVRHWRPVAIATAALYVTAILVAGPALARGHSSIDLTRYFNDEGQLPNHVFVMESRISFAYYLRPDVRARMHRDQVESFTLDELSEIRPFPKDAVLALPADLAERRLARLPELANGFRKQVGRYLLIAPMPFADER
jgi:4-amino-4-deoxy-L-arabinose transferase-like glycosyltransferase